MAFICRNCIAFYRHEKPCGGRYSFSWGKCEYCEKWTRTANPKYWLKGEPTKSKKYASNAYALEKKIQ